MKKRIVAVLLTCVLGASFLAGCGNSKEEGKAQPSAAADSTSAQPEGDTDVFDETTVNIFAAASLNNVMEELIAKYNETQPNVKIVGNYDSSGTLLTQIEEGADCDIFFSAAQKQMDQLDKDDNLVVDGTRYNVVNNQLCVVTSKNSGTKVTGLENIGEAKSLALADGSVPAGK